jgi:FMN-dependent oxidoreductase (nitrilotriacetate monooxygenase family)
MTPPASRQLHLNAFLMDVGHHEAAWRLPHSDLAANTNIEHYRDLAAVAERGTFDSIFFADGPALLGDPKHRPVGGLEPTVLLASLAATTERIGLIATASTTYNEPYDLARRFASIDHISNGRAGWNIVTTAGDRAAQNFSRDDQPRHRDRYARAAEFVEVSMALWDSWEDDAAVGDKAGGIFADENRIHEVAHDGEFFRVRGPLDVPRSPQGHPLLVQAGSSEDGKAFAARYAEAVFTAQQTLADGQAFYTDLVARTRAAGRDPETIKILPGIVPVIGGTEGEARALERELADHIVPAYGLRQLSQMIEVDLTGAALDEPLPELPGEDEIEGAKSRFTLVVELARRENLTVRQLLGRLGGGRGHRTFTGAPEQIADAIEDWFVNGAADGFNIMPPALPSTLETFVEHVVPELRRRGLFRTEYTGTTLRDHYGLARPENRFGAARAAQARLVAAA